MAQLKAYLDGLFWSAKDNIYTAQLNNVKDTILVHDVNDSLALERMLTQDPGGFKDGQKMRDLYMDRCGYDFTYNKVSNAFIEAIYNGVYSTYFNETLEDYTDDTTEEVTKVENEYVVTITPEANTLIKVEFYSNDSDYDITVTLTKTDESTKTFNIPADVDNPFKYFIDNTIYNEIEITWKYNETHTNTVTSYVKPSN